MPGMQKRRLFLALLLLCLPAVAIAATDVPPVAYSAEIVMVSNGKTMVTKVWSDGVRRKTELVTDDGSRSGSYADTAKRLSWQYGPGYPCIQLPIRLPNFTTKDEALGNELVDGHPTKKFRVTNAATVGGKKETETYFEWRATDLKDLVIQRKFSNGSQFNLRNIVVGTPEEKLMAFPSPPCKYDSPGQDELRGRNSGRVPLRPLFRCLMQEAHSAAAHARDSLRLRDPGGRSLGLLLGHVRRPRPTAESREPGRLRFDPSRRLLVPRLRLDRIRSDPKALRERAGQRRAVGEGPGQRCRREKRRPHVEKTGRTPNPERHRHSGRGKGLHGLPRRRRFSGDPDQLPPGRPGRRCRRRDMAALPGVHRECEVSACGCASRRSLLRHSVE